jgi:ribose/xylose/arabinose/galactoside ABC-type transport system permease subunit
VAAIVVAVLLTGVVDSNHSYFRLPWQSLTDILRNTALLGIFALGATVVIIAGGIDLSSGSMIALSGTIAATAMLALAPKEIMAFKPVGPAVVGVGVLAALLTGFLVGTLVGTKSAQINVSDPIFKAIRDNVWIPVAVFALLAVFTWLLLTRTVLGRHIHALGGNEQAARLAGIRTENVKWFAYCFGAMTAALAGLFYVANESVAAPVNQGRGHELNAIAAAVVGGCSLSGGVGTVPGTVLGAIFLRVVIDAVSKIIKTGADVYEGLIVGVVVVIAVTFSQLGALAKGGTRLLPGAIGLCAIPTLSLLTGALAAMTAGRNGGIATGVGALFLLGLLRVWESRRSTT